MKTIKFLSFAALAVVMSAFTSCKEEAVSELNEEAITVKSTITGFVQYQETDDSGWSAAVAPKGTIVRAEYTIVSAGDTITLSNQAIVNNEGKYNLEIIVPVGKKASCTLTTNFKADSYETTKDVPETEVSSSVVETMFYGSSKIEVAYGQTYVCNINAAADGVIEDPFYQVVK